MSEYLFSGLKVLDLGSVIAAPVAATILADFGAEVIKVETPGYGDILRMLSSIPTTPDADTNYFWQMDGRNKKSIALNLKTEEGLEILHKLIKECDVFITNQPFAVRRAFKLEYEDIKPLNPGMIYASFTSFGEEGADRDTKAFDLVAYWARSGLMDLARNTGETPIQALPGMGDHPTAIAFYACIVTALLKKEKTGEGSMVHTSLLANGLWSAAGVVQGILAGADAEKHMEAQSVKGTLAQVHRTKDDRFLQLSMLRTQEQFMMLLVAVDAIHLLEDERFAQSANLSLDPQLASLIQDIFLTRDSDEWLAIFESLELPVYRVPNIAEVVLDEQLTINNIIVPPEDGDMGVPLIINHPINVSDLPQVGPKRAPDLGEHSAQILENLGYSETEITALKDSGTIE